MKKASSPRAARSFRSSQAAAPASGVADKADGEVVSGVEPLIWFNSADPAHASVRVQNLGPSDMEVSLWSRPPVGVPEPGLLARLKLMPGHDVLYTASDVVRVEIVTEKPTPRQRLSYQVTLSQNQALDAVQNFRLETNRTARCDVTIWAQFVKAWKTRVNVTKSKTEVFKTVVDAGVRAEMMPEGLKVRLQTQGGTGVLPTRTVRFNSIG